MAELEAATDPRLIKALAHPLRVRILEALSGERASPSELADRLDESLANVSYHVRMLAEYGVLRLVGTTPRRGAVEHHYELAMTPVIADDVWGRLPEAMQDAVAKATLKDTARDIEATARGGGFNRPDLHLSRSPLVLDERGWRELKRALDRLMERAQEIQAKSAQRLKQGEASEAQGARLVLMLFDTPRRRRKSRAS